MLALVGGPAALLLAMWKLTTVPTPYAETGTAISAPAAAIEPTVRRRRRRRDISANEPKPTAPRLAGSGTAAPRETSVDTVRLKLLASNVKSVRSILPS